MNYLESKVLRYACTTKLPTFETFPDHGRQELGEAFQSLHRKGYVEAALLVSNGDQPDELLAGEIVRVLPRGLAYCQKTP